MSSGGGSYSSAQRYRERERAPGQKDGELTLNAKEVSERRGEVGQ
jgi:hypothetical protein